MDRFSAVARMQNQSMQVVQRTLPTSLIWPVYLVRLSPATPANHARQTRRRWQAALSAWPLISVIRDDNAISVYADVAVSVQFRHIRRGSNEGSFTKKVVERGAGIRPTVAICDMPLGDEIGDYRWSKSLIQRHNQQTNANPALSGPINQSGRPTHHAQTMNNA